MQEDENEKESQAIRQNATFINETRSNLLCEDPVKSKALPMMGKPLGPGSFAANSYKCLRDIRQ
jgi:hypothetical protein